MKRREFLQMIAATPVAGVSMRMASAEDQYQSEFLRIGRKSIRHLVRVSRLENKFFIESWGAEWAFGQGRTEQDAYCSMKKKSRRVLNYFGENQVVEWCRKKIESGDFYMAKKNRHPLAIGKTLQFFWEDLIRFDET